ncbi:MAG: tetratricopeptide repeat protein [Phycisphaerales bacterium]
MFAAALGLVIALSGGCAAQKSKTVVVPAPETFDTALALQLADKALAAQRDKKLDEAIELYKQAISANPELSGIWTNLGVALMSKQNFTAAAEAFKHAADLSPTDSRPLVNLGIAYLDRGWADQALMYFVDAIDRDPNNVEALRGAIIAAQRTGREDDRTLGYMKQLQLLETDPKWKQELGYRRLRLEGALRDKKPGIPVPEVRTNSAAQPVPPPASAPSPNH